MSATGSDHRRTTVASAIVASLVAVLLVFTGCDQRLTSAPTITPEQVSPATRAALPSGTPRRPVGPGAAPDRVSGGTGTGTDRLAADVVTGVEAFWREEFPARFGRRWVNINSFVAADPKDATNLPPCLQRSLDLSNQALYCPSLDTVAWDRVGLLPKLRDTYGDAAVIVALAHEIGHAVQDRLGVDAAAQQRQPERFPTILLEGMADCFAGVALHAVSRGRIPKLAASPGELDRALRALITFRDPVGAPAGRATHGNAFDRATAFIDGYQGDAGECAAMTADTRRLTQRGDTSRVDASRGDDIALGPLLGTMGADARGWFGRLATERGRSWQAPALSRVLPGAACGPAGVDAQGPVRLCPGNATVTMSREQLDKVHAQFGDYASATMVASRYALAALAAMGRPVLGAEAGRAAVCLSGAYTRTLLDRRAGFVLSPGDLDEAVDLLLSQDSAARDAAGEAPSGDRGFDRVRQFRAGALGGPAGCGV